METLSVANELWACIGTPEADKSSTLRSIRGATKASALLAVEELKTVKSQLERSIAAKGERLGFIAKVYTFRFYLRIISIFIQRVVRLL